MKLAEQSRRRDTKDFVDLHPIIGRHLNLKLEGLNPAGSVKVRAAKSMINAAERNGTLRPDSVLIESSSGNLGVALSLIAAEKGIRFVCITDARCNQITANLMRALGTELIVIDTPDPERGFLGARLDLVHSLCAQDERYLWLNQYANPANWQARYEGTAPELLELDPEVDVIFLGVGTGGTAMGCARYFRDRGVRAQIVALDVVGSVTFGGPSASRLIPGLGAAVAPKIFDPSYFDDLIQVTETDTIRVCRTLASQGLLTGGSTGTVVAGALQWLEQHDPGKVMSSVGISPDMGDRYLNTIYNDHWVLENFSDQALKHLDAAHPLEPLRSLLPDTFTVG